MVFKFYMVNTTPWVKNQSGAIHYGKAILTQIKSKKGELQNVIDALKIPYRAGTGRGKV